MKYWKDLDRMRFYLQGGLRLVKKKEKEKMKRKDHVSLES
jgi:hypothetical protein